MTDATVAYELRSLLADQLVASRSPSAALIHEAYCLRAQHLEPGQTLHVVRLEIIPGGVIALEISLEELARVVASVPSGPSVPVG